MHQTLPAAASPLEPVAESTTLAKRAEALRILLVIVHFELVATPGTLAETPAAPILGATAVALLGHRVAGRLAGQPAVPAAPAITGASYPYLDIPDDNLVIREQLATKREIEIYGFCGRHHLLRVGSQVSQSLESGSQLRNRHEGCYQRKVA
jgi:hypothetical protein